MRRKQLASIFFILIFITGFSALFTYFIGQFPELDIETSQEEVNDVLSGSAEEAVVTRVIDGDTVEIDTGEKVRYIGIDTPEDPISKNAECFALNSYIKNKELVLGKRVRFEKDVSDTDRYGRLLRYVYVGEVFVNLEMVKSGYAIAKEYPPDIKYAELLDSAEKTARTNNLGIWQYCNGGSYFDDFGFFDDIIKFDY